MHNDIISISTPDTDRLLPLKLRSPHNHHQWSSVNFTNRNQKGCSRNKNVHKREDMKGEKSGWEKQSKEQKLSFAKII